MTKEKSTDTCTDSKVLNLLNLYVNEELHCGFDAARVTSFFLQVSSSRGASQGQILWKKSLELFGPKVPLKSFRTHSYLAQLPCIIPESDCLPSPLPPADLHSHYSCPLWAYVITMQPFLLRKSVLTWHDGYCFHIIFGTVIRGPLTCCSVIFQ